jgi:hypothetical protein
MSEKFSVVATMGSDCGKMRIRQFFGVIPRIGEEVILPGQAGTPVTGQVYRIVHHLYDSWIGPSVWVSVDSVELLNVVAGWEIQDD